MNVSEDIIQRCHEQHRKSLRQRKTVVTPALHKLRRFQVKVYCARSTPLMLDDLEQANISFMPMGHAPENDRGPRDLGGERFSKRQGTPDWRFRRWYASWGLQIYTGIPSARDGANWHDFHFKYAAICDAPDAVFTCIDALVKTAGNPLLTLTKSGGLRFSCRIPNYLHPDTEASRFYTYKHTPTPESADHCDVYLEVLGDKGYSRWDGRYEILMGNLLYPPVIFKEVLFVPIDAFRAALHAPEPSGKRNLKIPVKVARPAPASIGSKNLDLAKAAFVKRGFSYLREDTGFHHWIRDSTEGNEAFVSLWEDSDIVWVRTSALNSDLATRAVPITDIWDDTGITLPISETGLLISDKIVAVRKGQLSPLAIKRSTPVHHRQASARKVYRTLEENTAEIQRAFESRARIVGIISEAVAGVDTAVEAYLRNGGAICLNVPLPSLAAATEQRYHARKLPSFAPWRARKDGWEQVKEVPVDVRMANPFQRGNLCEDPERCDALEQKGGDPNESICPQCPVYTQCQTRGYLSQPLALQRTKAQVSSIDQLFFNPQYTEIVNEMLEPIDETARICMIDERKIEVDLFFLTCEISTNILEKWAVSWRGSALGNFADALLNALKSHGEESNSSAIARVRAVVEGFQQHEEVIIRQMCHVKVQGRVVEREFLDPETGKKLAHFTIEFEGGFSAYIPLDVHAEDKLTEKGLSFFRLDDFVLDEDMGIPMQMDEAIALGILDTETVQKIQAFPHVSRNPNWTFWHQLKGFFAHYTRDADAPIRWNDEALLFWVPPVLHPSVKRLLVILPTFSEQYLRRVFPDEEIEIVHTEPTAWLPGNRVFQLRTGLYSLHAILNYDSDWDVLGLSKMGERFLFGIQTEIDRDPSVKHAIITNNTITRLLTDIAEKENVCFVTNFKQADDADFHAAEVLWVIGVPHWPEMTVWWRAQQLFGNDEKPLYYEGDVKLGHYKDERIQGFYRQKVVSLLTQIVGRVGLNHRDGKRIMLLTSVLLPDITDRPETLLFDWEDFEVAGGLDKLPEVIATRECFETERDNLTAESKRTEVERIFGCTPRHANFILQKLRGGNLPRFQEQILTLLADGEKKTSQLVAAIGSSSQSVGNELRRLVNIGEIVKVRRGVYALKTEPNPKE